MSRSTPPTCFPRSAALEKSAARQRECAARASIESALTVLTTGGHSVLTQIVPGPLNQIAAALGAGGKIIKFHRGNLMRKLGVRSVADLVRLTGRAGAAPVLTIPVAGRR